MCVSGLHVPSQPDSSTRERRVESNREQLVVDRLDTDGFLQYAIRRQRDELVADGICFTGEDDRDQVDGGIDDGTLARRRRCEAGMGADGTCAEQRDDERHQRDENRSPTATGSKARPIRVGCVRRHGSTLYDAALTSRACRLFSSSGGSVERSAKVSVNGRSISGRRRSRRLRSPSRWPRDLRRRR